MDSSDSSFSFLATDFITWKSQQFICEKEKLEKLSEILASDLKELKLKFPHLNFGIIFKTICKLIYYNFSTYSFTFKIFLSVVGDAIIYRGLYNFMSLKDSKTDCPAIRAKELSAVLYGLMKITPVIDISDTTFQNTNINKDTIQIMMWALKVNENVVIIIKNKVDNEFVSKKLPNYKSSNYFANDRKSYFRLVRTSFRQFIVATIKYIFSKFNILKNLESKSADIWDGNTVLKADNGDTMPCSILLELMWLVYNETIGFSCNYNKPINSNSKELHKFLQNEESKKRMIDEWITEITNTPQTKKKRKLSSYTGRKHRKLDNDTSIGNSSSSSDSSCTHSDSEYDSYGDNSSDDNGDENKDWNSVNDGDEKAIVSRKSVLSLAATDICNSDSSVEKKSCNLNSRQGNQTGVVVVRRQSKVRRQIPSRKTTKKAIEHNDDCDADDDDDCDDDDDDDDDDCDDDIDDDDDDANDDDANDDDDDDANDGDVHKHTTFQNETNERIMKIYRKTKAFGIKALRYIDPEKQKPIDRIEQLLEEIHALVEVDDVFTRFMLYSYV
jgi:hypothetical protein